MIRRTAIRISQILLIGGVLVVAGCKPHKDAEKTLVRPVFKITKKAVKGTLKLTAKLLKSKRAKRVAVSVVKKAVKGDAISIDPNDAAAALAQALVGETAAVGIELVFVEPKDIIEGKLKDTVTHYLIIEPLESLKRKRDDSGEEEVARCRATLKDAKTEEVVDEREFEITKEEGHDWAEMWGGNPD